MAAFAMLGAVLQARDKEWNDHVVQLQQLAAIDKQVSGHARALNGEEYAKALVALPILKPHEPCTSRAHTLKAPTCLRRPQVAHNHKATEIVGHGTGGA